MLQPTLTPVEVVRSQNLKVRGLSPLEEEALESDLSFPYEQRVSKTRTIPRVFDAYKRRGSGKYEVPRGYADKLPFFELYRDDTVLPPLSTPIESRVTLRRDQEGVLGLSRYKEGIVSAPAGAGKTVVAAHEFLCNYQTRTLVINKTRDLCEQWRSRLLEHTSVTEENMGRIGDGVWEVKDVTVATWQTLSKRMESMGDDEYEEFVRTFGLVIVDEAHSVGARKVYDVVRRFYCRYLWGLTATPYRSDEFSGLVEYAIGPVRHRARRDEEVPIYYDQIDVPESLYPFAEDFSDLGTCIAEDYERTAWIAVHVAKAAPTPCLVICARNRLVEDMVKELQALKPHASVVSLTGSTRKKERDEILIKGERGEYDYVVSTTLANEGLDWPPLKSICLAFPGRFEGKTVQQTGRLARPHPQKKEALVLDYVDAHGITRSQARARRSTYIRENYKRKESVK